MVPERNWKPRAAWSVAPLAVLAAIAGVQVSTMCACFRRVILGMAVAVVGVSTDGASAEPTELIIGFWTLDVEDSNFNPGPPPQSEFAWFEPAGDGVKVMAEVVASDGSHFRTEFIAKYDGKDYPVIGSPSAETVALKRYNAHETLRADKKGGTVTATYKYRISKHGKVCIVTAKGRDAKGQVFDNVLVFVRQ